MSKRIAFGITAVAVAALSVLAWSKTNQPRADLKTLTSTFDVMDIHRQVDVRPLPQRETRDRSFASTERE